MVDIYKLNSKMFNYNIWKNQSLNKFKQMFK